jgi:hypothetical protein
MPNLAGFGFIGELSIDTIRDMVNLNPVQVAGEWVYPLGGPFQLTVPLAAIPGLGTGTLQVDCNMQLDAVVRTADCRLTIDLSNGAALFGVYSAFHLGGTLTATATVAFGKDTDPKATPFQIVPSVLLSSATATVAFDSQSQTLLSNAFGAGNVAQITADLSDALQGWIRKLGDQSFDSFSFSLMPGMDSSDPLTVTATPQIMWIDESTLGVFGYYRKEAAGGNLAAKTDSDIVQPGQELIYDQNGNLVQTRRAAVLLSPDSFQVVIACPLIRSQIVRPLLHDQLIGEYQSDAHNAQYDAFYQKELSAQFVPDLLADLKNLGGSSPENNVTAFNQAIAQVQAAANQDVANLAEQNLESYLDSPQGQVQIAQSTPTTCGRGSVQAHRQTLPDPFGDMITTLTKLELDLAPGAVNISVAADGNLPVCGIYTVTQTGTVTLSVNNNGVIVPGFILNQPDVNITTDFGCKIALDALSTFFVGPAWGTIIGYGTFGLAEVIGGPVAAGILFNQETSLLPSGAFVSPDLGKDAVFKDLIVDTSGIAVIALIGREQRFNDFTPHFEIDVTLLSRESIRDSTKGEYHVAPTPWGCPGGDFTYTRSYYESVFQVSLSAVDVPLPITVNSWQIEIGNFSYDLPGVRDPRPLWSNEPQRIVPLQVMLSGEVWYPAPPMDGQFADTQDVVVTAAGTDYTGWDLGFSSQNGNFYVQVFAYATDGDGKPYTASNWFSVSGDVIAFGSDYACYQQTCMARFGPWAQRIAGVIAKQALTGYVPPGTPVESEQAVAAVTVARAIRMGDPAAYLLMKNAVARYGQQIVHAIANVPPATLGSPIATPFRQPCGAISVQRNPIRRQ